MLIIGEEFSFNQACAECGLETVEYFAQEDGELIAL